MKEKNNPFCKNCKEKDCLISMDDTCAMIREYIKLKSVASTSEVNTSDMLGQGVSQPVKLADILKVLEEEEYTVSVFGNDTVDNKITESIANNAIIDFKKQLTKELVSKFSA